MNYNHVELAGNIVFDVELRTTAVQGMSILRNRLAVNKKYKDQEQVVYVDFVAIGGIAETINKYCGKANTAQKTDEADASTVPADATPPLDLSDSITEADIPF